MRKASGGRVRALADGRYRRVHALHRGGRPVRRDGRVHRGGPAAGRPGELHLRRGRGGVAPRGSPRGAGARRPAGAPDGGRGGLDVLVFARDRALPAAARRGGPALPQVELASAPPVLPARPPQAPRRRRPRGLRGRVQHPPGELPVGLRTGTVAGHAREAGRCSGGAGVSVVRGGLERRPSWGTTGGPPERRRACPQPLPHLSAPGALPVHPVASERWPPSFRDDPLLCA